MLNENELESNTNSRANLTPEQISIVETIMRRGKNKGVVVNRDKIEELVTKGLTNYPDLVNDFRMAKKYGIAPEKYVEDKMNLDPEDNFSDEEKKVFKKYNHHMGEIDTVLDSLKDMPKVVVVAIDSDIFNEVSRKMAELKTALDASKITH
jgi:hypothetical protein